MTYHVDIWKILLLLGARFEEVLGFAWLIPAWMMLDHCIHVCLIHWLWFRQILFCKSQLFIFSFIKLNEILLRVDDFYVFFVPWRALENVLFLIIISRSWLIKILFRIVIFIKRLKVRNWYSWVVILHHLERVFILSPKWKSLSHLQPNMCCISLKIYVLN